MVDTFLQKNILFLWMQWNFFDAPKEILKAWKNFLLFNLNYFSIPILLKTFFSPWRRYLWSYGRGFDIKVYFEAAASNLISRSIGLIMRVFLIFIGLAIEIFIVLGGALVFLSWILLPFLLVGGLILGIKILF